MVKSLLDHVREAPDTVRKWITSRGNSVNIADLMTKDGIAVRLHNDALYDGASRIKTSSSEILFDSKNVHDRNQSLWNEHTEGGGTIAFNYNRSGVELSVGQAAGDVAERQTYEYVSYEPGKVQAAGITGVMAPPKPGLRQEYGLGFYGGNNLGEKLVFRANGTDLQFIMSSSVTGETVDTVHPRDEWIADPNDTATFDPFDGSGPSGIDLDITKIELLKIRYLWQGAGFYEFAFLIDGEEYIAHRVNIGNKSAGPWMKHPSLPILYRIENTTNTTSSATLLEVCSEISSENGARKSGFGFSHDSGITPVIVDATVESPVLLARLQQKYSVDALVNRINARYRGGSVFTVGNVSGLFHVYHVHGAEYSINIGAVTNGPFQIGETLSGGTSGCTATLTVDNTTSLQYIETGQNGVFEAGEVVTGLTSGASATIAVNGATVWSSEGDQSGIEVSVVNATTNLATPHPLGGVHHKIGSVYTADTGGNSSVQSPIGVDDYNKHDTIHQNRDSSNSEVLAIYGRSFSSTLSAYASIFLLESE